MQLQRSSRDFGNIVGKIQQGLEYGEGAAVEIARVEI